MPHTIATIRELLANSDKAVERGVIVIFERQTEDEKQDHTTRHSNGVGFNGFDAEIMSSFASQILRGWTLSPKQIAIARKKMLRYAGQLVQIANTKEAK